MITVGRDLEFLLMTNFHTRFFHQLTRLAATNWKTQQIQEYLNAKANRIQKKPDFNAARLLEESIQMLEMAKGLLPQINEYMTTVTNVDGEVEHIKGRNELCTTNLAMVGKAIELIGRNLAVRAFRDSLEVNHTHDLERMLNERGKELEEGARKRMEKLALVTTDE